MRSVRRGVTLAACIAMFASGEAFANGRFPRAQEIVLGAGAEPVNLAVRATFGIVVSDDGGRSFRYFCEEAFQYLDGQDPSIAFGLDGALLVGVDDGLVAFYDRCVPHRVPLFDGMRVVDLATNGSRQAVYVAVDDGGTGRVARSLDGGRTFRFAAGTFPGLLLETVEVASGDPDRVYVTGYEASTQTEQIHRSADGGQTWTRGAAMLAGTGGVYIAGVDSTNASRVYLRVVLSPASGDDGGMSGSALLRSDDGGDHVTEIGRSAGPMLGFALSDDGRHVWFGGADPVRDALQRSDDGGPFAIVQHVGVQCLRYQGGSLYACASFVPNETMVYRSNDDGATLSSLVRFDEVLAPPACPASTVVASICPSRWSSVRSVIAPTAAPGDAGRIDDRGASHDACACRAVHHSETSDIARLAILVVAAVSQHGRRRARR